MKSLKQVLKNQLEIIKPSKETSDKIDEISKEFIKKLNKSIKKKKTQADVFIGGSLAKKTLVKKGIYDVDIFVRFSEKYSEKEISILLGKILGKKAKKIHGSRDYYQIKTDEIIMEIIPVLKIKKPEDAKNVMDLSYFHVNYVLNKIKKKKKINDEIILAKSFCHAHNCYGAESYIRGFSGYALELLIIYYTSFEKFLKNINKADKKIIIDASKFYKKQNILNELNESKLNSPIVLIDPTYKQRNALAGLSKETFDKFRQVSKSFLKHPSNSFFIQKDIKEELMKKHEKNLRIISIKTNKQAGDIAGTKSKKFLGFLIFKIKREFEINLTEFDYNQKNNLAEFYFILGKKQDELIKGPFVNDKKNFKRFKQVHKKSMIIKGKSVYTKIKHNLSFEQWFKLFVKKEKNIFKQMSVKKIELVG